MAVTFGSYVANGAANGGSFTVARPSGTAAGSFLLAEGGINQGAAFSTLPAGFTTIINSNGLYLGWKIATGSEPSTYSFAPGGTLATSQATISRWEGVDTASPVVTSATATISGGVTTATSPSVTPTAAGQLYISAISVNGAVTFSATPSGGTLAYNDGTQRQQAASYETTTGTTAITGKTWSWSGSNTMVIASIILKPAAATVSSGAITMAGTGTLAGSGSQTISTAATLAGSSTLNATGRQDVPPAVTMSGTGSLTASGRQSVPVAVTMAGSGALASGGQQTSSAGATLAGSGALTVTGQQSIPAAVTLAGAGTLSAGAVDQIPAAATLAGTSSLTTAPDLRVVAAPTLAGSGTLDVAGRQAISTTVTLAGTGDLAAAGLTGSITLLAGTGTLEVSGAQTVPATSSMSGTGELTIAEQVTRLAAIVLAGTSGLSVDGDTAAPGTITLAGLGSLLAVAASRITSAVTLAGTGTLEATGTVGTVDTRRDITITARLDGPTWTAALIAGAWTATTARSWAGTLEAS